MGLQEFINYFQNSIDNKKFVKVTLSKPFPKNSELKNIYIRFISVKKQKKFSFTYRYQTNDKVKNYLFDEAKNELEKLLESSFKIATLFTTEVDFNIQILKNGQTKIKQTKPTFSEPASESHDREKKKRTGSNDTYLYYLGVTNKDGQVIPKMANKYRQINKYLETIEGLIKTTTLSKKINIVDMGSGKGYLTFALYDYLSNKLQLNINMVGIELREELVKYCNDIAQKCSFQNLRFESKPIETFESKQIDILIALHACDTATDDAIYKGILSKASLIVCVPCCHKQIRQQLKGKEQKSPILKYGIFKERQYEMITDTIRALLLEKHQYQTTIFEFISNEHTHKNILLAASKSSKRINQKIIDDKISAIKNQFGIDYHYLEKAFSNLQR